MPTNRLDFGRSKRPLPRAIDNNMPTTEFQELPAEGRYMSMFDTMEQHHLDADFAAGRWVRIVWAGNAPNRGFVVESITVRITSVRVSFRETRTITTLVEVDHRGQFALGTIECIRLGHKEDCGIVIFTDPTIKQCEVQFLGLNRD